jgi:hypothetical protein
VHTCAAGCTHCSNGCTVCSNDCTACSGCSHPTCQHPTCGQTIFLPHGGGDPQTLAALKAQLQQALSEVERQEKDAQERMRPQTVAEVDELQKKLQSGLDELKKRRAELEQKEKSKK